MRNHPASLNTKCTHAGTSTMNVASGCCQRRCPPDGWMLRARIPGRRLGRRGVSVCFCLGLIDGAGVGRKRYGSGMAHGSV